MVFMTNSQAWDYAIGMIKVDGLEPTEDFKKYIEKEKRGEKRKYSAIPYKQAGFEPTGRKKRECGTGREAGQPAYVAGTAAAEAGGRERRRGNCRRAFKRDGPAYETAV